MPVDITAPGNERWFERYKYDIPVLHLNGRFLAKHRLQLVQRRGVRGAAGRPYTAALTAAPCISLQDAFEEALRAEAAGTFVPPAELDPNPEIDAGPTPLA